MGCTPEEVMPLGSCRFEKVTANLTKENHSNLFCNDMLTHFINSRHQPTDDIHLLWLKTHFFFSFSESSVNIIFISGFSFTSWKTHFPWWSSQLECKGLECTTVKYNKAYDPYWIHTDACWYCNIPLCLSFQSKKLEMWLRFLQERNVHGSKSSYLRKCWAYSLLIHKPSPSEIHCTCTVLCNSYWNFCFSMSKFTFCIILFA